MSIKNNKTESSANDEIAELNGGQSSDMIEVNVAPNIPDLPKKTKKKHEKLPVHTTIYALAL